MPKIYHYERHPRVEELKVGRPVKTRDMRKLNHPNWVVRFNARFGLLITLIVGTMWCAYLFTALTLISLPAAIHSHDPLIIVAWIAQTFLQLVLLSIILVGQRVQSAASDARAEKEFADTEAVLDALNLKTEGGLTAVLEAVEGKRTSAPSGG